MKLEHKTILEAFRTACIGFLQHTHSDIVTALEKELRVEVIHCEDGDMYINHQLFSLEEQEAIALSVAAEYNYRSLCQRVTTH